MDKGYECVNCHEMYSQKPLTVCERCLMQKGINPHTIELRDEIVMRAIDSVSRYYESHPEALGNEHTALAIARSSYALADEMLKARAHLHPTLAGDEAER